MVCHLLPFAKVAHTGKKRREHEVNREKGRKKEQGGDLQLVFSPTN